MRWFVALVTLATTRAEMIVHYSNVITSRQIYMEEGDILPFTGLAATTSYISWKGDTSTPDDPSCDGVGSSVDLDGEDASAAAGASLTILNLGWSDASFTHFKFQECSASDDAVDTMRTIEIGEDTHTVWDAGAHNKFVLTTKNGGATPTQVEFHFDLATALGSGEYIYLQTVEDQGNGFGVVYHMWAAVADSTCTVDVDEAGEADDVVVAVSASTGTTYDTLKVTRPVSPSNAWYAGATLSVVCTSNLQPNPNPKTDFKIAAISHTTTDLAKTISYQVPALVPVAGAGPADGEAATAWYVLTTDPTALTGGGMVPNTLVAGRVPTSSVLTLGVVTPLADTQTIVCTFSQAVWSGDVTSNPAVSGGSSTATAAATSSGAVITMTATRAFPAATYTFTFTDNLGANPAAGAVTSNCSSTQDVTLLSGTAFTTTAATKVDWTIGGGYGGYAKPTGTGRFNTGVTPATYDFKFDVSASGALVSGNTIVLKAVRGGSAVKIWNAVAAVTCGTLTEDGSAFTASSIAASGSPLNTLTITLSSGIGNSATVIISCSSNIAANAAASGDAVSIVATTSADTAVADSKADTSGGSTAQQAQYFWTITAVTSVDWTIDGADSGYAKPDAGANSTFEGYAPANFSFSFDVSEFGSLVSGDTIVLKSVRDGAAIKVWNAAAAVTCGTLTQDGSAFNASSIVASASTGSTFDTLTITLSSGIADVATVVIVCTGNIAANAAASSHYVSFGATTTCDATSSNSYNGGAVGYSYVITAPVVVASVDVNTQVVNAATTFTFTTSGGTLESDGSNKPYIKFTVAGAAHDAVGVVGWAGSNNTQGVACVYASGTTCTVNSTATVVATGNLGWYSVTEDGVYGRIGSVTSDVAAAVVAVQSVDINTQITGDPTPFTFTITGGPINSDGSNEPYIKMTISGTSGTAVGVVGWNVTRCLYATETTCTVNSTATVVALANEVWYSTSATGTYAALTGGAVTSAVTDTPSPTPAPTQPSPDAIEDAIESVNQTELDVIAEDYGLPGNVTVGSVTTTSTTVVFTCEACGLTNETFNDTRKVQYRGVIANISGVNISQVAITGVRNVTARRRRLLSSSCPAESLYVDTVITSLASVSAAIEAILDGDEFPTTIVLLIVGGCLMLCFIMPAPGPRRRPPPLPKYHAYSRV